MSYNLLDQSGNRLIDQSGNKLVTVMTSTGALFPPMLLMRLRLHAILFWGTILLMQTIP